MKFLPSDEASSAILEYVRNLTPVAVLAAIGLFSAYQGSVTEDGLTVIAGLGVMGLSLFVMLLNVRSFYRKIWRESPALFLIVFLITLFVLGVLCENVLLRFANTANVQISTE